MKISRVYGYPNKNTFLIDPINSLIRKYIHKGGLWIDPFANNSCFSHLCVTNDLNPAFRTDCHMDALDFLKTYDDCEVDGILFDPPYSLTQLKECYEKIGNSLTQNDSQKYYSNIRKELYRILKPNGVCISFGWNSIGIGLNEGITPIIEVLLVNHAGNHHDTIVTVQKRVNGLDVKCQMTGKK